MRPKPKIPFLSLSLLWNLTEMLASQAGLGTVTSVDKTSFESSPDENHSNMSTWGSFDWKLYLTFIHVVTSNSAGLIFEETVFNFYKALSFVQTMAN